MEYLLTFTGKDVLSVIKAIVGESYALELQKQINWTGKGKKYEMRKSASADCITGIEHTPTNIRCDAVSDKTQKLFYIFQSVRCFCRIRRASKRRLCSSIIFSIRVIEFDWKKRKDGNRTLTRNCSKNVPQL